MVRLSKPTVTVADKILAFSHSTPIHITLQTLTITTTFFSVNTFVATIQFRERFH